MYRLEAMLKRTIPEIIIEYNWYKPAEVIVVEIPNFPKEIIPDMLHNVDRFFNLSKNV